MSQRVERPRGESFISPWDEQRPDGSNPLWAVSGFATEHWPMDIHIHRGVEVGVLLKGEEELHYSDFVLTLRPGDVWLCNIYEPHGTVLKAAPRHSIVTIFIPDFIGDEMLGELPWLTLFAVPPSQRPRVTTPEMRRKTLAIGNLMRREIEEKPRRWEGVVRLELLHMLIELSRGWRWPGERTVRNTCASAGWRGSCRRSAWCIPCPGERSACRRRRRRAG